VRIFCLNGFVPEIRPHARFWSCYSRSPLKPFRYIRDPLFLCACALYALNRLVLKPHLHSPFLRGHFNDLLLIPCAMPPLLLVQRQLRLRPHDEMPTFSEIVFCLVTWSLLFEWIGPRIISGTTADLFDAVAYFIGAIIAFVWWKRSTSSSPAESTA
jgi:hypothetical protein